MKVNKMRAAAFALGLLLAAPAGAAEVEGVTLPPELQVVDRTLPLRGCGVREAFFMNVYVAGLYLPEPNMKPQAILSADTPKAVRLQITYDGVLPQDVPDSWVEPLKEMVQRDLKQTIGNIYQDFQSGDQVTITYGPQAGTQVMINGKQTRDTQGHQLIEPLLRLWIGDRAVSPSLRQDLLGGSCGESGDGWF